ncbi:MAG: hypothetical protein AB7N70_22685 [Dehalococcoidia bacterium]
MATGTILTVLSKIPWAQVVENAPRVAEGAAKLWRTVTGLRKSPAASPAGAAPAATADEPLDDAALRARVQSLTAEVHELQEQMRASSELIKALADQDTELVKRVELNRRRVTRLAMVGSVAIAVLLSVVVYLLATT